MKKGIFAVIPPALMTGKSLIIISAVVISAFSFSLGYIVGKREDTVRERRLVETRQPPREKRDTADRDDFDRTVEKIIRQDLDLASGKKAVGQRHEEIVKDSSEAVTPAENGNGRYTIQVGAFTRRSDAERLSKRLEEKGFGSYIVTVKSRRGRLFKVRVNRYADRKEAEKDAARIKRMKGLDALVMVSR